MSDIQKFREQYMAKTRAKERGYAKDVQSNVGKMANLGKQVASRFNPAATGLGMMFDPRLAGARDALTQNVVKPTVDALSSSVLGDNPLGNMPVSTLRQMGGNRIMPNAQMRTQDLMTLPNLAVEEATTPLNFMGAGLLGKGTQGINKLTGPKSGRGMMLSSLDNFISGFYGGNPGGATLTWAPENLARTFRDLMDPGSRALYKETGATRGSQDLGRKMLAEGEIHRGLANTGQYLSRIREQGGREGAVADVLLNMENLSDYVPARSYQVGDYKSLVKEKGLYATTKETGRRVNVKDNDLDIIESHFGRIWKEPGSRTGDVSFADAADTKLAIKAPGAGGAATGKHFNDVLYTAPFIKHTRSLFRDKTKVPHDELIAGLRKASEKDSFRVLDVSSPENGIWLTGGRKGSAVTEGGINYLVKVEPNGRMIGVMSDEHNLYESLAGKVQQKTRGFLPTLDMMKKLIPHRLVAVTPPMIQNIRNIDTARSSARGVSKVSQAKNPNQVEGTAKEMLQEFVQLNPSQEARRAEQLRQVGGGMLTTSALNDEED